MRGDHGIKSNLLEVFRQVACHAAQQLARQLGMGRLVRLEARGPLGLRLCTGRRAIPIAVNTGGNFKWRVAPAQRGTR